MTGDEQDPLKNAFEYLSREISEKGAPSSFCMMAELLSLMNQQDEMLKIIESLAQRIKSRRIAFYMVSQHFFWRGKFQESLFVIEKILEKLPEDELLLKSHLEVCSKINLLNQL